MRISDWSSDVCSSDLGLCVRFHKVRSLGSQPDDGMACALWWTGRHDLLACRTTRDMRLFPAQALLFLRGRLHDRSEEHTSELQSLMRISYAVFCLKNKTTNEITPIVNNQPNDVLHLRVQLQ